MVSRHFCPIALRVVAGSLMVVGTACHSGPADTTPSAKESARAVGDGGRVEIRLGWYEPRAGESMERISYRGREVYVSAATLLKDSNIRIAEKTRDESLNEDQTAVLLTFDDEGAKALGEASADHLEEPLVLMVDGAVVSCPVLMGPISHKAILIADQDVAARVLARHGAR